MKQNGIRRMTFLPIISLLLLLSGCSPYVYVINFPTVKDEKFTKPNLRELIREKRPLNIVLRVPNSTDNATSNSIYMNNENLLYNSIEKQLVEEGFNIRDRGLINEMLKNSRANDYNNITALTDVDIILDVVDINKAVLYSTNKVTPTVKWTGKVKPTKTGNANYYARGAAVKYKLVLVKNNEVAGLYTFYYKPCVNGCLVGDFKTPAKKNREISGKEYVATFNEIDNFIKESVKQLAAILRE